MDLFAFVGRGVRLSGGTEADRATEKSRQHWLDKLLVDETRAWMSISEADRGLLSGLAILLTLAGLAHAHDTRDADTPAIRVIRGAISAAEQCGKGGSVIQPEHARAFSAACSHARRVLQAASLRAIQHAAVYLNKVTR